jgi:predicted neutral ceramidase superfamily lipid hydrolase
MEIIRNPFLFTSVKNYMRYILEVSYMSDKSALDLEDPRVSRKSPGLFGYFHFFQTTPIIILLMVGLPLGVGTAVTLLGWIANGTLNWMLLIRETLFFAILTWLGTIVSLFFRYRAPLFTFRLAYLINAYGTGMFAASYLLGHVLDALFGDEQAFVEIFFILGALICYIVLFVIIFSFTPVGNPWYIFIALIQPTAGILMYSLISRFISWSFLLRAAFFFVTSALIFAMVYAPMMATVSLTYRKTTGIGGYNFIRAFVQALLLDNQDESIERYFAKSYREGPVKLQYIAFRDKKSQKIKGVFLTPNIHFGPFKTAGSAALGEHIYQTFGGDHIPGLSVFHTTATHGQNFTSNQYNEQVLNQIREDLKEISFTTSECTQFHRTFNGQTKVLGATFNEVPLLLYTRHPEPTDDIMPEVGEQLKQIGLNHGFQEGVIVDCHNSLIGDEVLVQPDSPEAKEMVSVTEKYFSEFKTQPKYPVKYGVAHDNMKDIPISAGIGAGGITVHLFDINGQKTALIHIDANNAFTPVRSAILNLGQNKGIDRVELTTSDTHAVVRIISSQGYYPLGTKLGVGFLVERVGKLLDQALSDLTEVDIGTHTSIKPGYQFWKDISSFEVIVETIERCLTMSKILLTVGLVVPMMATLLFMLFYWREGLPIR